VRLQQSIAVGSSPLKTLHLHQNAINDEGISCVCDHCVALHPNLGHLSLWSNSITAAGARPLASLMAASRLETLILYNNSLGDEGVVILAAALRNQRVVLSTLNLNENRGTRC
jgi:Ran GTPase-activating protein (RanGAP) involved in mRNA processing and transport